MTTKLGPGKIKGWKNKGELDERGVKVSEGILCERGVKEQRCIK